MKNYYRIKHKLDIQSQNNTLFNNERIQTCIGNEQYIELGDNTQSYFLTPINKNRYTKKVTTPLNTTYNKILSPLLQIKINRQMKYFDSSSPVLDQVPPLTQELRHKARKLHHETLSYNFVKDWEKVKQLRLYRMKKQKENLYKFDSNPLNGFINTKFPENEASSFKMHNRFLTVKSYSSITSPQMTETSKLRFVSTPSQQFTNNFTQTAIQKKSIRIPQPQPIQINKVNKKDLEALRDHQRSQSLAKTGTNLYHCKKFILDISNLDQKFRKFLIDRKRKNPLGEKVKYQKKRELSNNKDLIFSNSTTKKNTSFDHINLDKQTLIPKVEVYDFFQSKIKKHRVSTTIGQRMIDYSRNPYDVDKKQKIVDHKSRQNFFALDD